MIKCAPLDKNQYDLQNCGGAFGQGCQIFAYLFDIEMFSTCALTKWLQMRLFCQWLVYIFRPNPVRVVTLFQGNGRQFFCITILHKASAIYVV